MSPAAPLAAPIYPNRLAEFMTAAGLDDPTLARLIDSTKQQIFKLRSGLRKMTRSWAERIAPHVNATWPELIGWVDPSEGPKLATAQGISDSPNLDREIILAPEEIALIALWRELSKDEKRVVLRAAGGKPSTLAG